MADLVAIGAPIYCGTAFIAETLRSGGQANRATLAMKNRLTASFGKTGYAKIRIPSRAPSLRSLFECGVGRADFLDPLLGKQASSSASKGERAVRSVPIALPGRRSNIRKGERLRHASMRRSSKTAGLTGVLKV
jgi:hypothetical protein